MNNQKNKEKGAIDQSWNGVIKWGGISLIFAGATGILFFMLVVATGQTLPIPAEEVLEDPKVPTVLFTIALIGEVLLLPCMLGLYFSLKGVGKNKMVVAAALWILCVAMFLASRGQILAISQISDEYNDATDPETKESYLASAELAIEIQNLYAMMALSLLSVASIIIGIVMLKGKEVFGEKIGYVVIGSGVFTLFGALTVVVGAIPIIIPVIGAILTEIWQFYIGFKMYKLGCMS